MPLRIDTSDRAHDIARAIDHLIVTGGLAAISLRNIASIVGRSPAALTSHLTNRERMLRVSAALVARDRLDATQRRARTDGVAAFLPLHEDDVPATRAWLGWLELGRSGEGLEHVLAEAHDDERRLLAQTLDHRLDPDRLDLATAIVEGLRSAVCASVRPMPVSRAQSLLARGVGDLLRRAEEDATAA